MLKNNSERHLKSKNTILIVWTSATKKAKYSKEKGEKPNNFL